MKKAKAAEKVEMIPTDRITVINPRVRNKKVFKDIVSNIAEIGLKRPITVTVETMPMVPGMTSCADKVGSRRIRLSASERFRPFSLRLAPRTAS